MCEPWPGWIPPLYPVFLASPGFQETLHILAKRWEKIYTAPLSFVMAGKCDASPCLMDRSRKNIKVSMKYYMTSLIHTPKTK